MKITVIRCKNSGLVHAAKLIEKGHEIRLFCQDGRNCISRK
jgi:hypothetical protein